MATVSADALAGDFGPFRSDDPRISKLIARLADPDPVVRQDSLERLVNLGDAALPALRQLVPTADFQTRSLMDQVLLHVPWVQPGDSDVVEQDFAGYAAADEQERCSRIEQYALQSAAGPALLRILLSDPSAAVRWCVVDALESPPQLNDFMTRQLTNIVSGKVAVPQAYLPPNQNAPLLAAAGLALNKIDSHRETELMEQAAAIETEHPTAFNGQMDSVHLWLINQAMVRRDYPRVVDLFRQRAARIPWDDQRVPEPVSSLLAAQAEYGPFPGWVDDLRSYRCYFSHPEMVYSLGRLAERDGHAVASAIINTIALAMSGMSFDNHYEMANFLITHNWDDAGERELQVCLQLTNGRAPAVYLQLANIADHRDDDLAAARNLETCQEQQKDPMIQYGRLTIYDPDSNKAKVHWHYLRAARQVNDLNSVRTHLDKLLLMDQDVQILHADPNLASDIVPALQDLGRIQQADQIFDTAYKAMHDQMVILPADYELKNNLAWLCACSGKRLTEAAGIAADAVAAEPENPNYLDTQADLFCRLGQPHRAIEIESHALAAKPGDLYMQIQMKRFRAAAAKLAH